jgi:hypothetical protein
MELLKKDIKEYTDHFSKDLSPDIKKYAVDEVFKSSRYIFTRRIGKQQYGYCTNCHKEFKTDRFTHNTKEECPGCKSICIVKASGLGRKKMIDEAYFVYYEKSVINSKAIVARGIYAVRDYSEEYRNIETKYLVKVLYLFDVGHGGEMIGRYGYYSSDKTMKEYGYEKCKSIYSLASRYYQSSSKIIIECSIQSIKEAVKDTPFQYSTWESYSFGDMVNFFGLFAKYPCVEYLTKLGFNEIVREKIVGNKTYSCINWRGKSLNTVVKLTKKEIDAIKSRNKDIYPFLLKLYQISKNDGSNLTIEEIGH